MKEHIKCFVEDRCLGVEDGKEMNSRIRIMKNIMMIMMMMMMTMMMDSIERSMIGRDLLYIPTQELLYNPLHL
jgi:hypothetical protein